MKKFLSIAIIVACTLMVFSCKNGNKEKEEKVEATDSTAVNPAPSQTPQASEAVPAADNAKEAAPAAAPAKSKSNLTKPEAVVSEAVVEQKPSFNGGGSSAFLKYVQSNINYPEVSKENGDQGKVMVSFTVGTNGKVSDAKVIKSVSKELDAEALRVVNASPAWTPGKKSGKTVPVSYTIPVVFALR